MNGIDIKRSAESMRSSRQDREIHGKARIQLLVTAFIAVAGAMACLLFPLGLGQSYLGIVLLIAVLHTGACILFGRLKQYHFAVLSIIRVVLLGGVMHMTGGIASPFTVIFFFFLISSISMGVSTSLMLPLISGIYLSIVFLEYSGILPQTGPSAAHIYRNPYETFSIAAFTVVFMVGTGHIHKFIMRRLRYQLERAHEYKAKISEMNGHYQVGFMVSEVLHELCSPLTCIYGYISWVKQTRALGSDLERDLGDIQAEIERLNNLVVRLRSFTKPGEGVKDYFVANEVVDMVIAILKMNDSFREVSFVKNYDVSFPLTVYGCRDEIQEVFFNLMKNSAEAVLEVPEDGRTGRIDIAMSMAGDVVEVKIKDNGKGMMPDDLAKATRNFFTTKTEGWGLGLGIVRNILLAHGSELMLKSERGAGTEARFCLPIRTTGA